MGKDTGPKGDVLVEVAVCEAVSAELEFGRADISEICVEDSERVEFCDMVSANLICAHKQLRLRCVVRHKNQEIKLKHAFKWSSNSEAPPMPVKAGAPSAGGATSVGGGENA